MTIKRTLVLPLAALVALSSSVFAQAKKKDAKPAEAAPAAAPADTKPLKPLPMNSRADEIDAAGKSWTQINKDGKRVKHTVTAKTEIKQGEADAKFEDIKVGDTVSGLRYKTKEDGTEYEVVKITKFGPKAPKAGDKAAEAKPTEAKKK